MKKILSIIICVCTVLSVSCMTSFAYSSEVKAASEVKATASETNSISGKWLLNETLTLDDIAELGGLSQTVNFTSFNCTLSKFIINYTPAGGPVLTESYSIQYVDATDGGYFGPYSSTSGWAKQEWRTIDFGSPQTISRDFYLFIAQNATLLEASPDQGDASNPEVTHNISGIRYWKSDLQATPDRIEDQVNFTSNNYEYTNLAVHGNNIYYNNVCIASNNYWENKEFKTIDFGTTPQAINEDIYNYIINNTTTTPPEDNSNEGNTGDSSTEETYTISGKWRWKKYLYKFTGNSEIIVNFTSKGMNYISFCFVEAGSYSSMYYTKPDNTNLEYAYYHGTKTFIDEDFRTIDFGITPQNIDPVFYEYLLNNAQQIIGDEILPDDDAAEETNAFLSEIFGFLIPGKTNTTIVQALNSPLYEFDVAGTHYEISIMQLLGVFAGVSLTMWFFKIFSK